MKQCIPVNLVDICKSMNNLGAVLQSQNKLDEALKLHTECLEMRKQILSQDHPDTLTSMNNLAVVYQSLNKFEESAKLHAECLELR
jgi:hypothetical protein